MITGHRTAEEQVAALETSLTVDRELAIGNSRFGIGLIMTMAGFIGLWGFLCLANGIAGSASIEELGRGAITALTGVII